MPDPTLLSCASDHSVKIRFKIWSSFVSVFFVFSRNDFFCCNWRWCFSHLPPFFRTYIQSRYLTENAAHLLFKALEVFSLLKLFGKVFSRSLGLGNLYFHPLLFYAIFVGQLFYEMNPFESEEESDDRS